MPTATLNNRRLSSVTLDEASIGRGSPDQEHERAIAIYDIVQDNKFTLPDHHGGPYQLNLAMVEKKLVFEISHHEGGILVTHYLSLSPFRGVIKDYSMICESYYQAIRTGSPEQLEAIDMGRRALHNEAAELVRERLEGKVIIDLDTARRLFTLVYALHWRG
jgi:uncharacterized protein (UPF0262 family)